MKKPLRRRQRRQSTPFVDSMSPNAARIAPVRANSHPWSHTSSNGSAWSAQRAPARRRRRHTDENHQDAGLWNPSSSALLASLTLGTKANDGEARLGSAIEVTFDDLHPGSYAYNALKRRFDDLDEGRKGYVTARDMNAALTKLGAPVSEASIQEFMCRTIDACRVGGDRGDRKTGSSEDETKEHRMSLREFGNFALRRERELLKTFQKFDTERLGYLTGKQLKKVLMREGYTFDDSSVEAMMTRIKSGSGAFSKGKGLFNASNEKFVTLAKAIDFTEFRDFLMLSDALDSTSALSVWSKSTVDVGDVSLGFASKRVENGGAKDVLKHLLVGAVSGGVSRTIVAPLERAKIEYMLDSSTMARDGGLVGTLTRIWRNEGPGGWFRGNALNVARIAPTKAVELFIYDKFKATILQNEDQTELTGGQRMLGGSVASMCGTALTHPIDTLRSRVSGTGMPMGECWAALVANEGYGALWKGLGANMVRVAPYGAINYAVYDFCKATYRRVYGEKAKMAALPTMCFGALAGAAAQTGVYPLEMIQRRMQVQGMKKGVTVAYKNMFHGIYVVFKSEGIGALYAGLVPNYAKILPSAAVSFYCYELLKEILDVK